MWLKNSNERIQFIANYISENKAYVKVKLGFPINMDEMKSMNSIDKML